MNFNDQLLNLRLNYFVLLSIRILLLIGGIYFFLNSYSWSVLQQNDLDPAITTFYEEMDKSTKTENAHKMTVDYSHSWINAEKKFDNAMGILCLVVLAGTLKFREEKSAAAN